MPFRNTIVVLVLVAGNLAALDIQKNQTVNSKQCDIVTWTDASGKERSAALVRADGDTDSYSGGYIERYTYYVGTELRTGQSDANEEFAWLSGLGTTVNHYADKVAVGKSATGASSSFLFEGDSHCIWRFQGTVAAEGLIGITVDYLFQDGRSDVLWASSYDTSSNADSTVGADARGPYVQFDWDGDGQFFEAQISGIRWGDTYKFRTVGYETDAPTTSSWDYSEPNTVPYMMLYKDSSLNDTEAGVVQTQPWSQQDAGGYWWYGSHGQTGSGMPENWNCPFQLNAYEDYSGEKMAWGTNYGYVGHSAYDTLGYGSQASGYPHQGYSTMIMLGRHSEGGTDSLIGSMEAVQGTIFTALVGTVTMNGPDHVGLAGDVAYEPAGWDHRYGMWRASVNGSNQSAVNLRVASGTLVRPSFAFSAYAATSLPASVYLNGNQLTAGTDYEASVDDARNVLYVTLASDLTGNTNVLSINTDEGCPPEMTGPKVFVFAGQSNMSGAQADVDLLAAELRQSDPNIKAWKPAEGDPPAQGYWVPASGEWQDYQPQAIPDADWWEYLNPGEWWGGQADVRFVGPDVTCIRDIQSGLDETIYLVKYSYGGTSLAVDWPSWGSLYNAMRSWVNMALADLRTTEPDAHIAGFFWMQGEADAFVEYQADAYESNMNALIARVRTDFGNPDIPFVLGRIHSDNPADYTGGVRSAQVAVAEGDDLGAWVNTDDFTLEPNPGSVPIHFGEDDTTTLGNRMAAAYLRLAGVTANAPPTADAGVDRLVTDSGGDGAETVTLDGTASSDDEGILSWSWSQAGAEIATGETPDVSFDVGVHAVLLTVADALGATGTDTVMVEVAPGDDVDDDGMADAWELANGLDPTDPADADYDPDGDWLSNLEEHRHGTDPGEPDTDQDGTNDGDEVAGGTDPLADDAPHDDPPRPDGAQDWQLRLWTSGAHVPNVVLGMNAGAEDGLDGTHDVECPPPDEGTGYVSLTIPGSQLVRDLRAIAGEAEWTLLVDAGEEPVDITWQMAVTPLQGLYLVEVDDTGVRIPAGVGMVMDEQNLLSVPANTTTRFAIRFPGPLMFALTLEDGWNLVSIPVAPFNSSATTVLQGRNTGPVWGWATDTYAEANEIAPGHGYWVYYSPSTPGESASVVVAGEAVGGGEWTLGAGWHLIGPLRDGALQRPAQVYPPLWFWDASTQQYRPAEGDQLVRGLGYWLYAGGPWAWILPGADK